MVAVGEFAPAQGYLALYFRLREGEIHETFEVSSEISADADREGRVIGVEVVKTFAPFSGLRRP